MGGVGWDGGWGKRHALSLDSVVVFPILYLMACYLITNSLANRLPEYRWAVDETPALLRTFFGEFVGS